MFSCSKEDTPEATTEDIEVTTPTAIDYTIKASTQNNIIVGNRIPLILTNIIDENSVENIIYKFMPVGNDLTKHQQLNKDYYFLNKKKKKSGIFSSSSYKKISSLDIDNTDNVKDLFIQPLVAGSFQLNFTLQKYNTKTNEFVGEPITKEFIFNAVKINFTFPKKKTRESDLFNKSKHRRWWKFSIDDGDRKFDTYLSNTNVTKEYIYETRYDSQKKSGNLAVSTDYDFRNSVEKKQKAADIRDYPQKVTIIITQLRTDGTKNIIEYKDMNIY